MKEKEKERREDREERESKEKEREETEMREKERKRQKRITQKEKGRIRLEEEGKRAAEAKEKEIEHELLRESEREATIRGCRDKPSFPNEKPMNLEKFTKSSEIHADQRTPEKEKEKSSDKQLRNEVLKNRETSLEPCETARARGIPRMVMACLEKWASRSNRVEKVDEEIRGSEKMMMTKTKARFLQEKRRPESKKWARY